MLLKWHPACLYRFSFSTGFWHRKWNGWSIQLQNITSYYQTVHSSRSIFQSLLQHSLEELNSSSHLFARPPQLASEDSSQSFTHCSNCWDKWRNCKTDQLVDSTLLDQDWCLTFSNTQSTYHCEEPTTVVRVDWASQVKEVIQESCDVQQSAALSYNVFQALARPPHVSPPSSGQSCWQIMSWWFTYHFPVAGANGFPPLSTVQSL